jgi:ribosomal protein S27E
MSDCNAEAVMLCLGCGHVLYKVSGGEVSVRHGGGAVLVELPARLTVVCRHCGRVHAVALDVGIVSV